MSKAKTRRAKPLANIRASAESGQEVVDKLRRDAQAFIARSRTEMMKEIRGLERWALKGLHAASTEQVARLERRVTKLEEAIAGLRRQAAEQAA